jgi:YD repeat-containing protein
MPEHRFDYTKVDLTEKYTPPILGIDTTATQYEYNKDKQILKVIRPDGGIIETIYDSVGCSSCGSPASRPKTILFDRGSLNFRYSPITGRLDTLLSPSGLLSFTYDGSLPKSVTWSGEVQGTVSVEYDNDWHVVSQSINGGNTVGFQYDQDDLLTRVGEMNITREPETGRISGTALGNVTTSLSYNELGELRSYEGKYGANPIFSTAYQRDSLGRIIELSETVLGITTVKKYDYDIAGRLWKVWKGDTLISTYSYDANGNRIAHLTPTTADSGTYDVQDRMLAYGNARYVYTANGELQMKMKLPAASSGVSWIIPQTV